MEVVGSALSGIVVCVVYCFDSVLSASVAVVGPVAMSRAGSDEMRRVQGFDFVVSVSVLSVDSVVMGWMEVVGSVVSENVAGVGRGWAELNGGNRQDNLYHLACY